MKRFLFVPAIALALIVLPTASASAQEADPVAELVQLRQEHRTASRAYDVIERGLKRCLMPDEAEIVTVLTGTNAVSRRAGELAWRLGGQRHVEALTIQSAAESDFWRASHVQLPDVCYQPPA